MLNEALLISYLDFLQSSFAIVSAAGYGKGHTTEYNPEKLKEKLKEAMLEAAKELNFERATMLRDKMLAVKIPKPEWFC